VSIVLLFALSTTQTNLCTH